MASPLPNILSSILFANAITGLLLVVFITLCQAQSPTEIKIENILADSIDIEALYFGAEALKSIEALRVSNTNETLDFSNSTRVDTHGQFSRKCIEAEIHKMLTRLQFTWFLIFTAPQLEGSLFTIPTTSKMGPGESLEVHGQQQYVSPN